MTSTVDEPPEVLGEDPVVKSRDQQSARAALLVFAAVVVIAVPVVLFRVGSYHWFFRDDFFFLSDRKATSLHDLMQPFDGHWSTVPLVVFRTLWEIFGLRSYVPYQASVLALHLGACGLLRVIMRRAGVGPWIATAVAAAFILFGPGEQDIIWAFQVGFTGSLTFGLAQLVLLDHDGPVDRRDALGLAAGILALLSSGVGIAMALVAGLAALGRRGWRVATLHTAPLAVMYAIWWSIERPSLSSPFGRPSVVVVFRWIRSAEIGIFLAVGHYQVVAALLAVAFVVGLVLAWWGVGVAALRHQASIPASMLVGAFVFAGFTALGRWQFGSQLARSSRYVHIGTALTLPAIAVAITALARRRREVGIAAVALLVVAIPWNATHFGESSGFGASYMKAREQIITNVVRLPEAREVSRDVRPIPDVYVGPGLTIGFLLDAEKSGRLDASTAPLSPAFERELRLRLAVAQRDGGTLTKCRKEEAPVRIRAAKGTRYGIYTAVKITLDDPNGRRSPPLTFTPTNGRMLTVELGGLTLDFAPPTGSALFVLCSIE